MAMHPLMRLCKLDRHTRAPRRGELRGWRAGARRGAAAYGDGYQLPFLVRFLICLLFDLEDFSSPRLSQWGAAPRRFPLRTANFQVKNVEFTPPLQL